MKTVEIKQRSVLHYSFGFWFLMLIPFSSWEKVPFFENYFPIHDDYIVLKSRNRGRKRLIRVEDCVWSINSMVTGKQVYVCIANYIWHDTDNNISFYLWFGRHLFVCSFTYDHFAMITFPNEVQIMDCVKAIETNHPGPTEEFFFGFAWMA